MSFVRIFQAVKGFQAGPEYGGVKDRIAYWLDGCKVLVDVMDRQMSTTSHGGYVYCTVAIFYRMKEGGIDSMDPVQQVASSGGDSH